jgi:hypothetical protein
MDALITFITVVGGLLFSIAVAVVVEEFIFGQIFKLFFASPKTASSAPATWVPQTIGVQRGMVR